MRVVRRIAVMIVGVMLVNTQGVFWVYAQSENCGTCLQAPSNLDLYFRTMDKLIALLNTGTPPDVESGTGIVGEISEATFAALMTKDMALMTSVLATVLTTQSVADVFTEFKLLAGSEARKRERDKLLEYDHKIMMRTLELTKSDRIGKRVPIEVLQKVDAALQELGFVRLAKIGDTFNMYAASARYEDLAALMRQLNGFMKQLHSNRRYHTLLDELEADYLRTYHRDQKQAIAEPKKAIFASVMKKIDALIFIQFAGLSAGRTGAMSDRLEFTNDRRDLIVYIREIQDAYVCSTSVKNQCNARAKAASDGRTLVKDRWNTDSGRAMDTFKTARSRLMGTLFKDDAMDEKAALQRKNALLQSIYGQDIPEKQKWRSFVEVDAVIEPVPSSVSSTWKFISRLRKKESDPVNTQETDKFDAAVTKSTQDMAHNQNNEKKYPTKNDKDTVFELFQEYLNEKEKTVWTRDIADLRAIQGANELQTKITSMHMAFTSVLDVQYQLSTEQALFTDVNRVTKRFPQLSASVYKNIALIGDKNEAGVYSSMIQVCSAQCENLDPVCQHDDE